MLRDILLFCACLGTPLPICRLDVGLGRCRFLFHLLCWRVSVLPRACCVESWPTSIMGSYPPYICRVSSKDFYLRIKAGILQYCVIYPMLGIMSVLLESIGWYHEGVHYSARVRLLCACLPAACIDRHMARVRRVF